MIRDAEIEGFLEELRSGFLERSLVVYDKTRRGAKGVDRVRLDFSSNDYLDLCSDERVIAAACEFTRRYGAGTGASRLVSGTFPCHEELEAELSSFFGSSDALCFGSGALCNLGVLSSIVGREDVIIADRLVHATLIDGALLSRAGIKRFRHNDLEDLESCLKRASRERRRGASLLVLVESLYSMDGDLAPVGAISELVFRYDASLMVDEAHAIGVFGRAGRGVLDSEGLFEKADLVTGTLSKALGSYGGFVCCSGVMKRLLVNRSREFIYSTALPPSSVGAALASLSIVESQPRLGDELLERSEVLRESLSSGGLDVMESESQIVPVLVASNDKALRFAARLREKGILAVAIREPTVPKGTARIRFSVTLAYSVPELENASEKILKAADEVGVL